MQSMSQAKYDASRGMRTVELQSANPVKLQILQHAAVPGIVQVKGELSHTHIIHPVYNTCAEIQWQGQVSFTSNASVIVTILDGALPDELRPSGVLPGGIANKMPSGHSQVSSRSTSPAAPSSCSLSLFISAYSCMARLGSE